MEIFNVGCSASNLFQADCIRTICLKPVQAGKPFFVFSQSKGINHQIKSAYMHTVTVTAALSLDHSL